MAQVIVAILSLWRPRFRPKPDHFGFVVVKVTLELVFLWVLRFLPVNTISLLLHTHISYIYNVHYIIPAIYRVVK